MAGRRLDADEAALWARVQATAKPLDPARMPGQPADTAVKATLRGRASASAPVVRPAPSASPARVRLALSHATLDGHWDRRLRRGLVEPDLSIDLHGHTLSSAQALVDATLARAVARGARLVLIVAGRARDTQGMNPLPHEPRPRGAIRAALPGWLAHSPWSPWLAALRPAHRRHGGAGALYLVLRQ